MYSVLRFQYPPKLSTQVRAITNELNRRIPDFFDGLDRVKNRFSCSVSTAENWRQQTAEIAKTLTRLEAVLKRAKREGFTLELDIFIEHEDFTDSAYESYSLSGSLMSKLSGLGIVLTMTIANPRPAD